MPDPTSSSQQPPSKKSDEGERREANRLIQLVFEFLGYLAVLGYVGWKLDERNGWNGTGLFGGLMLALAAWIYRVLRVYKNLF